MTCWFWNNNCVIDYPSWFQAIGSVLAIFAAIAIAYWQNQVSEKNSKQTSNKRRDAQLQVGYYFARQVGFIFQRCMEADYIKDIHKIKLQQSKIDDLLIWSRIFVIDTFDGIEMHGFLEIRDSAYELKNWVENAKYERYATCQSSMYIYKRMIPWLELFGVKPIDLSSFDNNNSTLQSNQSNIP